MSYPTIYIISLRRTPERRLYIQRQLRSLNLNYRFVDAIDKYDLSSRDSRARIAKQVDIGDVCLESIYKNCQDIGPVACLLSHLKVYHLMIKNNIKVACVLEDDSHILPVFPKILTESSKVPWDIFMLSSHSVIVGNIGESFLSNKRKLLRPFIGAYKLMYYRKYWPQLDPYTRRNIVKKIPKHILLKYFRGIKNKELGEDKKDRSQTAFAVEIGALPDHDKSSWYKIAPNHYAANPYINMYHHPSYGQVPISIVSCMAYMLKRSAAIKWKQAVIRLSQEQENISKYATPGYASRKLEIDHIPRYLYYRGEVELYILVLPCIKSAHKYMTYSSRLS